jgi:hypothetical protein
MTTNWAYPNSFFQYAEPDAENVHVPWLELENFQNLKAQDNRRIKTTRDLIHIARDPRHNIREKTYFLKMTNFIFTNVPATPTGIELKITMNRYGRITDDTIQLTLDDEIIGSNKADLSLDLNKIYGSDSDMWSTTLSSSDIVNSSFGIIMRFQSHPNWPHKCSPFIDAVELRIH